MTNKEFQLMKGNEAFAEAAIRAGTDAYFGYPITPQSEVIEYLMAEKPHERTGMLVLQVESELAAINMVYGGGGAGRKVITSSSGPGISLMQEGISYLAGAEVPALILNVSRGGPGLGTIQPSQSDYFQSTKGGGHGDYRMIVLAPSSVQEMADFVNQGFELAFKYRNPVLILSDGVIGQMMEKVTFSPQQKRLTPEEIDEKYSWATTGKKPGMQKRLINSLELDPVKKEMDNIRLQKKYREMEKEVRFESINCDDAEYLFVAFGSSARVCQKAMNMARSKGIKAGLFRPITLFPFPYSEIKKLANQVKGMITVEMNAGQMVEDVRYAVAEKVKVEFYGRMGGIIPLPDDVLNALIRFQYTNEY